MNKKMIYLVKYTTDDNQELEMFTLHILNCYEDYTKDEVQYHIHPDLIITVKNKSKKIFDTHDGNTIFILSSYEYEQYRKAIPLDMRWRDDIAYTYLPNTGIIRAAMKQYGEPDTNITESIIYNDNKQLQKDIRATTVVIQDCPLTEDELEKILSKYIPSKYNIGIQEMYIKDYQDTNEYDYRTFKHYFELSYNEKVTMKIYNNGRCIYTDNDKIIKHNCYPLLVMDGDWSLNNRIQKE